MAFITAKQKERDQAIRRLEKALQELETATAGLVQRQHEGLWDGQYLLHQGNELVQQALAMPWRPILTGLDGHQWERGRQQLLASQRAAIDVRNALAVPVLTEIQNDSTGQPQEERERRIVEALLSFPCDSHTDLPRVIPLAHMNNETWAALTIRYVQDGVLALDVWVEARAHLRDKAEANGLPWTMPDLD